MTEFPRSQEPFNKPDLSRQAQEVLESAQRIAKDLGYTTLRTQHLLLALIEEDPVIEGVLSRVFISPDKIRSWVPSETKRPFSGKTLPEILSPETSRQDIRLSRSLKSAIDTAYDKARRRQEKVTPRQEVTPLDLLTGIISEGIRNEHSNDTGTSILERIGFNTTNIDMLQRIYNHLEKEYKER